MEFPEEIVLKKANAACKGNLMETLDIEFIEATEDCIVAKMPVTPKVYQPDGVLHGGATLALAETVGSFAAHVYLDTDSYFIRGIDISAQHVKSVKHVKHVTNVKCKKCQKCQMSKIPNPKIPNPKSQIINA